MQVVGADGRSGTTTRQVAAFLTSEHLAFCSAASPVDPLSTPAPEHSRVSPREHRNQYHAASKPPVACVPRRTTQHQRLAAAPCTPCLPPSLPSSLPPRLPRCVAAALKRPRRSQPCLQTNDSVYDRRRACEQGPCGHLVPLEAKNCVNECVSPECYRKTFAEPVRDGGHVCLLSM